MNEQILTVLRDACCAAPAVLAFGIVSPTTLAATGDLDPGFADVGRLVLPDFLGPAFSVEAQDDSIILAGGKVVPDFNSSADDEALGFARRLSGTGTLDPTFAAPGLERRHGRRGSKRSPDGTIVGVGKRSSDTGVKPVVVSTRARWLAGRWIRSGRRCRIDGLSLRYGLSAVDPGGAVVIAATCDSGEMPELVISRSCDCSPLASLDVSFGTAGVFTVYADD